MDSIGCECRGLLHRGLVRLQPITKNKTTDLKIEQFKKEEGAKSKRRNDSSAIVFGELWNVRYSLSADRVYIVQPHPLGNECLLSVFFEVKAERYVP